MRVAPSIAVGQRWGTGAAIRVAVYVALASVPCASAMAADDQVADGPAWVARYIKLGGEAKYDPDYGDRIQIDKRGKAGPSVAKAGPAAVPKVALCGSWVTDDDVAAVSKWKGLKELHLVDCEKVTDAGVLAAAKGTALTALSLEETAVTGKGVAAFSGCKTLTRLKVTNVDVECRLTELKLGDMPALESLVLACPEMKAISLSNMPKLTYFSNIALKTTEVDLSNLPGLDSLEFRNCQLTRLTISKMPGLKEIDLRKTDLGADAVKTLRQSIPGVEIKR